jgi:two-component system LytT family response regulator
MNINCLIIDDEPYAVDLLEIFISQSTNWNILAKCYNAMDALAAINDQQPHLVFLDINMPTLNGLELAGLLPPDVKIIFTTAYSEHAAESYNYQAVDYLLKPLTLTRFITAVQKAEAYFSQFKTFVPSGVSNDSQHFYIKSGKTLHKVLLADILYFEGKREYVSLVTRNERLLIYRRLKDIEKQFAMPFIRVHNSFIINTMHLIKVLDNHIHLASMQIPISDKFRESFMQAIDRRII